VSDQSARSAARLNLRLTPAKLETWRATARAEGLTLTGWLEALADDAVTVRRQIVRNDELEAERGRRWHEIDPSRARLADWGRLGQEEDWA
jgi:hypothetical protein